MTKDYTYKKVKNEDEIVLNIQIENSVFTQEKDKLFKKLSKEIAITGFRPGKAPKPLLEAKLGPDLYEKTINKLLPRITMEIMQEEKLEPITQVKYEVKKVSDSDGLEYSATFVVFPSIKLGNFTKIKIKETKVDVTENEIDAEEKRIIEMYNKSKIKKDKKATGKITDELVKSLNIGVDDRKSLREQIKQQLTVLKNNSKQEEKMKKIIAEAIKLSKISAPAPLVETEIKRSEEDYTSRIEKLGLKLDDFLKAQKTTLANLQKDWKVEAQRRVETELLLFEIAKINKFIASKEEIDTQINSLKDEKLKKQYDSLQGKRYISSIIIQQKSLQWLSKQVNEKKKK